MLACTGREPAKWLARSRWYIRALIRNDADYIAFDPSVLAQSIKEREFSCASFKQWQEQKIANVGCHKCTASTEHPRVLRCFFSIVPVAQQSEWAVTEAMPSTRLAFEDKFQRCSPSPLVPGLLRSYAALSLCLNALQIVRLCERNCSSRTSSDYMEQLVCTMKRVKVPYPNIPRSHTKHECAWLLSLSTMWCAARDKVLGPLE
jgi:hypothetical protein